MAAVARAGPHRRVKDDEVIAHYARADGGSPGVIRIGQLAERVVVTLPRLCILRTTEPPPPRLNQDSKATARWRNGRVPPFDKASTLAFGTDAGIPSRSPRRFSQRTSSESGMWTTVRSLRDRSDAKIRGSRESFSVAVLHRWAGEVWSFRGRGSGDTVEAMKPDFRVVCSTVDGDLRKGRDPWLRERRGDGDRVRVRREIAGRRGKGRDHRVGCAGPRREAEGARGGTQEALRRRWLGEVWRIEIQGDHRDVVVQMLQAEGYRPVLAGG